MQPASPAEPLDFQFATVFSHSLDNEAFNSELFDFPFWRRWMKQNFTVPILLAAFYLVLVFGGRRWMTHRPPYKLRTFLVIWNITFAVFSFIAFWRTFPDLWAVLWQPNGFYKSVCSSEGLTIQFAFWSWVGTLSKIGELGDTAFIVLRKQPLILLHWYHHATTMLYTWYTFPEQEPCHRWLMTMNFFIHILMYCYYAVKATGFKPVRRAIAVGLTTLQIVQMIVGIFINWYTWKELDTARGCERHHFNLIVAGAMYVSYFVLFANFFYTTYCKSIKRKQT